MRYISIHVRLFIMTINDIENLKQKYWISLDIPKSIFINFSVNIWRLGTYENSMIILDSDSTRSFLVNITPYRFIFRVILVPRDPLDKSEMIDRTWSLVTRLLTLKGFLIRMSRVTLENELIRCLGRGIGIGQNWYLWTEKCPRPWWWYFLLCDLGFSKITL